MTAVLGAVAVYLALAVPLAIVIGRFLKGNADRYPPWCYGSRPHHVGHREHFGCRECTHLKDCQQLTTKLEVTSNSKGPNND